MSAKGNTRERRSFDDRWAKDDKSSAIRRWHGACSTGAMTPSFRAAALLALAFALSPIPLDMSPDAFAQERYDENDPDGITLSEIVPLLADTPAGDLVVAPAPAPGRARRVRRSQVLRALRRAGMSAAGLSIPRSTTVRRAPNELEGDALRARALPPIEASLAPCRAQDIRLPRSVSLPPGRMALRVDAQVPNRSGRTSGVLILEARGVERRLPFSARVSCPPPAMQAGATIRILARFGNVSASAPGEATQSGRVGDIIRVRNTTTRRALRGRILDGRSVEVVR